MYIKRSFSKVIIFEINDSKMELCVLAQRY